MISYGRFIWLKGNIIFWKMNVRVIVRNPRIIWTADKFTASTAARDIQKALNTLPSITPETVTVTKMDVTDGVAYTVTFNSERGR